MIRAIAGGSTSPNFCPLAANVAAPRRLHRRLVANLGRSISSRAAPTKALPSSIAGPSRRARSLSTQQSTVQPSHPDPVPPASSPASSPSPASSATLPLARDVARLFEDNAHLRDAAWARRLKDAVNKVESVIEGTRAFRIGVVGSASSGVSDIVDALLDEPMGRSLPLDQLRSAATASIAGQSSDVASSRPLLIRYGPQIGEPAPQDTVNLPLRWMEEANVEIVEVKDPQLSSATLDTLYDCDALLFVVSSSRLAGLGIASSALSSTGQGAQAGISPSLLDPTLALLSHFADKPGTRLLLDRPSGSGLAEVADAASAYDSLTSILGLEVGSTLARQARASGDPLDGISAVSAQLAAEANASLRKALGEPGATRGPEDSARLWDDFSSRFAASAVGRVRGWVERPPLVEEVNEGRRQRAKAVALQSADVVLRHALEEAAAALGAAREEMRRAEGVARVLEVEAEEGIARLKDAILPGWQSGLIQVGEDKAMDEESVTGIAEGTEGHEAEEAKTPLLDRLRGLLPSRALRTRAGDRSTDAAGVLADSRGQVEETLSWRLPWWKLGLRVDDVRAEVEAAVGRSFAKDLETKLIFEAGNLPSVALASTERTERALAELSRPIRPSSPLSSSAASSSRRASPFASAVLLNSIASSALKQGSSVRLTPHTLSRPISARREQLLWPGGALDALAARAQSTMLGTSALVGGVGLGSLVCGAMGHAALSPAFPPHLVETFSLQPSNAVALTALAAALAAWRTQGRWGKAKAKFWQDWQRLARGLEDDLERNLDDVLRRHVFARALAASEALRDAAAQRDEELRSAVRELEGLQARVRLEERED